MFIARTTLIRSTILGIIAIAAVGLLGPSLATRASGPTAFATQVSDASTPVKGISVDGVGKVTVAPDLATIGLGVQAQAATASAAQAAASASMARVIAAIRRQGVAAADMTSQWISLQPQYAESPGISPARVSGYQANQSLSVNVRHIDRTGALIDAAVAAGATQVNGVSFSVADPTAATAQARTAAMTDARQRALSLAQAAGVSLGAVVSISEVSAPAPVPVYDGALAAPMARTPIQPGTTDLEVDIQVTFAIGS